MYKLIRRISSSFFPRPDRPWNEDATSNAPQIGQKRRLSPLDEDDAPDTPTSSKKLRREDTEIDIATADSVAEVSIAPQAGNETEGVKEVTKGVEEVELEDKQQNDVDAVSEAAAVPLPSSPVLDAQPDTGDNELPADEAAHNDSSTVTNVAVKAEGNEMLERKDKESVAQEVESETTEKATETLPVEPKDVSDVNDEPRQGGGQEAESEVSPQDAEDADNTPS